MGVNPDTMKLSITKEADEEGQKSQLVKDPIAMECGQTYADKVEHGEKKDQGPVYVRNIIYRHMISSIRNIRSIM